MDLKTITVDGLSVETTEAGAQAISKLSKDLETARKATDEQREAHGEALAAKDREIATRDAEIDDLKGKVLSDADLDARVNARADLIATAKQIADKNYDGLSDAEIRKTAVAAKLGQQALDGKSDDYVQARFDILAEDAHQDPVRKHIKNGAAQPKSAVDESFAGMVDDLQNAWKGGTH